MDLRKWVFVLALVALVLPKMTRAADDDLRKELDKVKRELEEMKKERTSAKTPIASAQASVENKYGPNAAVTTKQGKLTISGLVQVWYYSIQNDNIGFFGDVSPRVALGGDTNEMKDNDSFAIRRAQLRFTMDIHENVSAVVMIDPARAITGRPSFPTNVGLFTRGREDGFSGDAAAVRYGEDAGRQFGFTSFGAFIGTNAPSKGILEDAYINYHGVVPHHDFTVGQYKPFLGEEGIRSDASLDFIERSMIGQTYESRDTGLTVHGTWWDDRFQYWLGAFNDAGNWFQSAGPQQNRVDDNDNKSFTWRVLVRPLWKNETWGSLELGASGEHGIHGEAGGDRTAGNPVDGLGFQKTSANRYYAWASYRPGGPVKGWWLKGEFAWLKDRNASLYVAQVNPATGFVNPGNSTFLASVGAAGLQIAPNPSSRTGFYFATGYKISDSVFKDSAPGWLKNFEFAFRYEQFQNVQVADLVNFNRRTDVFATDVWTGGINYYIKGDNAKIQINYNVVDNPDAGATVTRGFTGAVGTATGPRRNFHAVDNNSLVVNFQVAW
ncbi:MAG: hypothetical protein HY291_15085 [Planctomycetes bacterium]|nr:hypothetical protein [Planctomycetota bacterium]